MTSIRWGGQTTFQSTPATSRMRLRMNDVILRHASRRRSPLGRCRFYPTIYITLGLVSRAAETQLRLLNHRVKGI